MGRDYKKELKNVLSKNTWLISRIEEQDHILENFREAINYALEVEDGLEWLRGWTYGDSDALAELAKHKNCRTKR